MFCFRGCVDQDPKHLGQKALLSNDKYIYSDWSGTLKKNWAVYISRYLVEKGEVVRRYRDADSTLFLYSDEWEFFQSLMMEIESAEDEQTWRLGFFIYVTKRADGWVKFVLKTDFGQEHSMALDPAEWQSLLAKAHTVQ
jgi:hypothetical protein